MLPGYGLRRMRVPFGTAEIRIVKLVASVDRQQLREVAAPSRPPWGRCCCIPADWLLDAFVRDKEEQLVLAVEHVRDRHRTADGEAVLIPHRHRLRHALQIREERRRGEPADGVVLIGRSVQPVGAGLDDDVDGAAAGVAVSRVGLERLHLQMRDRVHRRTVGEIVRSRWHSARRRSAARWWRLARRPPKNRTCGCCRRAGSATDRPAASRPTTAPPSSSACARPPGCCPPVPTR